MNAYKSRLLAEARGDVNRALDILLHTVARLDVAVSHGFVRAGDVSPADRVATTETDEADAEAADTGA